MEKKTKWIIAGSIVGGFVVLSTISAALSDETSSNAIQESSIIDETQVEDNKESSEYEYVTEIDGVSYKDQEGLIAYKELQERGYEVDAVFLKEALTNMNGPAGELFEKSDPNLEDERLSMDAFVVSDTKINGNSVLLEIKLLPKDENGNPL